MKKIAVMVFALAGLSACGGGGSNTPTTSTSASYSAVPAAVVALPLTN